ncbi:hypothetical protein JXZ92_00595 [Mycoplasma sp. CSL10137]|uniref:MHJ_0274 family protein n=1 Tax=unclassified Mycoplasma TaxID=2683645 RepID=UPI00197CAD79|nr:MULTISPECIES: hypothetical protein [unclassified Mycoplasma]MBN4083321.1 hypothetical protein [Mycoplasma sp. CSL10137]MBU4692862.1 hypothetical protein [Mycoplasma sp. CSL7491-lung]
MLIKVNRMFEETNTTTTSSSSISALGSGNIIIWVILGVLLSLIGVYFVYSYIKEKIEKKRTRIAAKEFENDSLKYRYELMVKINELIELNTKIHDDFVVSIGEYKMGQINNATRELLENIMSSYEYKTFVIPDEKLNNLKTKINMLKDLNSNLWNKKLNEIIIYFKEEEDKIHKQVKEQNKTEIDDLKDINLIKEELKNMHNEALIKSKKESLNEDFQEK